MSFSNGENKEKCSTLERYFLKKKGSHRFLRFGFLHTCLPFCTDFSNSVFAFFISFFACLRAAKSSWRTRKPTMKNKMYKKGKNTNELVCLDKFFQCRTYIIFDPTYPQNSWKDTYLNRRLDEYMPIVTLVVLIWT